MNPPCHTSVHVDDTLAGVELGIIFLDPNYVDYLRAFANLSAFPAGLFISGSLYPFSPDFWCYREYVWGQKVNDQIGDVDFDLPLPPKPASSSKPMYLVGNSGLEQAGCGEAINFVYNASTNSFRVHIPACLTTLRPSPPVVYTTFPIYAYWSSGNDPAAQSLSVCFKPKYQTLHGDSDEEIPRLFVGANGHFAWLITDRTPTCINVNLSKDRPLVISAHGFECDLSCGENPGKSRIVNEPDDVLGTILYVVPADSVVSGVTSIIPRPTDFSVCSQPVFGISQRQASLTHCDYKLNFSIESRDLN
jgi:hypothetical protein